MDYFEKPEFFQIRAKSNFMIIAFALGTVSHKYCQSCQIGQDTWLSEPYVVHHQFTNMVPRCISAEKRMT